MIYPDAKEYYKSLKPHIRKELNKLRKIIKKYLKNADEKRSYGIIKYVLENKTIMYIGGFEHHSSIFPAGGKVIDLLKDKLVNYKVAKGTIQFPHGEKIPEKLVKEIIKIKKEIVNK